MSQRHARDTEPQVELVEHDEWENEPEEPEQQAPGLADPPKDAAPDTTTKEAGWAEWALAAPLALGVGSQMWDEADQRMHPGGAPQQQVQQITRDAPVGGRTRLQPGQLWNPDTEQQVDPAMVQPSLSQDQIVQMVRSGQAQKWVESVGKMKEFKLGQTGETVPKAEFKGDPDALSAYLIGMTTHYKGGSKQAFVPAVLWVAARWLLTNPRAWMLLASAYPTLKEYWAKFQDGTATKSDAVAVVKRLGPEVVSTFMGADKAAGFTGYAYKRDPVGVLDKWMRSKDTVTWIAAAHGGSRKENKRAHQQLIQDLQSLGINTNDMRHTRGEWEGTFEPSMAVKGLSFDQAMDLARKYDQDAFIFKDASGVAAMYEGYRDQDEGGSQAHVPSAGGQPAYGRDALSLQSHGTPDAPDLMVGGRGGSFALNYDFGDQKTKIPWEGEGSGPITRADVEQHWQTPRQPAPSDHPPRNEAPRTAARMRFEDEMQTNGELALDAIKPGDRVRFNADLDKPGWPRVDAGTLGTVRAVHSGQQLMEVEALTSVTAGGNTQVGVKTVLVGPDEVTAMLDSRDPRVSSYRIGRQAFEELGIDPTYADLDNVMIAS